jgi:hypothetical protein
MARGFGGQIQPATAWISGLTQDGDGLPRAVEPGLHPVEHRFVLPVFLAFELVRRALGFEPAGQAAVRLR